MRNFRNRAALLSFAASLAAVLGAALEWSSSAGEGVSGREVAQDGIDPDDHDYPSLEVSRELLLPWLPNCELPQGKVTRLLGTVSSESGAVSESIEMKLLVSAGLVEAQVSCAERPIMNFVGCVGFDNRILLRPVSGSEAQWADWRLEWRPVADGIEVEGGVVRTGDENLRVKLHAVLAHMVS